MVEYKSPKVIEKVPEVMGLNVGLIVILAACLIGFIYTAFNNFFHSLIFVIFGGGYYYLSIKFPQKGELMQYIKYETSSHCIKVNQEIRTLIKTK